MKDYCITKEGYTINEKPKMSNDNNESVFWDAQRIKRSEQTQYYTYATALELAKENHCKSVLDIGCGVATQLNHFFKDEFDIYGIDQQSTIDITKSRFDRGVYVSDDFDSPTFSLKKFIDRVDLIICADVIEHLVDPDKLLDYIKKFAHKDTFIVISTPERNALRGVNSLRPNNTFHIREWAFDEFRRYIESSGFKIEKHEMVLSIRFRLNRFTLGYLYERLLTRLPLKHQQMVTCQVNV